MVQSPARAAATAAVIAGRSVQQMTTRSHLLTADCCCCQTAANIYSAIFYAMILPMLSNVTQSGKMVARLPLFWIQSHQRRMFPGARPQPLRHASLGATGSAACLAGTMCGVCTIQAHGPKRAS